MQIIQQFGTVKLLKMPSFQDARGEFIKMADQRMQAIVPFEQKQLNYVVSHARYTCRGLHYQSGEAAEAKIFRVISGAALLVAFHVLEGSDELGATYSILLDHPELACVVPRGFATGYCTLVDHTSVLYSSDNDYNPARESGIRWNDPALRIEGLPEASLLISEKDQSWPDFKPQHP